MGQPRRSLMTRRRVPDFVRATCPRCGDVHLALSGLSLTQCGAALWYQFTCPRCRDYIVTDTDARIATAMVEAGAEVRVVEPPAELDEPHLGPPVTPDELLDLHLALDNCDWVVQLGRRADGR